MTDHNRTRRWSGLGAAGLLVALSLSGPRAQVTVTTYESVTVATTAVGLATATTNPTGDLEITRCRGRLETAQVRQRWDGTNPTSTEGELVDIGDVVTIEGNDVARRVRWIRTGSTSGVMKVHCWRS